MSSANTLNANTINLSNSQGNPSLINSTGNQLLVAIQPNNTKSMQIFNSSNGSSLLNFDTVNRRVKAMGLFQSPVYEISAPNSNTSTTVGAWKIQPSANGELLFMYNNGQSWQIAQVLTPLPL